MKVDGDACWPWQGRRDRDGYGMVDVASPRRTTRPASKVAHELFIGPVPDGLCVLHNCDNPPCVNPSHLRLGTKADNAREAVSKGRPWGWKARRIEAGA